MKSAKSKENLRQRAYLNTITNGIDFGTQQVVAFLLNPLMVSVLGPILYGAWKVIGQLNNYMAMSDLRVSQPLKLLLSMNRTVSSDEKLTRQFSVAFFTMLVFMPLYIIAGTLIIWFSPKVTGVSLEYYSIVRIGSAFLISAFVLKQIFSIYESVLRGMNLAYKRIGVRSLTMAVGGGLSALILLYTDYGIPGLAFVQIFNATVTGVIIYRVVKKEFEWVRLVRVEAYEIFQFVKVSGWFLVHKAVKLADDSMDMILLAMFIGPEYVSVYVITKYLTNPAQGVISQFMPAITPGIGKLMGEGQIDKLVRVRKQLISINWALLALFGSIIIIWNEQFVALWTSAEYFGGKFETLLIVLIASLNAIVLIDGSIINMNLDLRKKIIFMFISAAVSIVLSIFLIPIFSIKGLLLSIIIGKTFILAGFPLLVSKIIEVRGLVIQLLFCRQAVIAIIFMIVSYYIPSFGADNWFVLFYQIVGTALVLIFMIWFVLFSKTDRNNMISNFSKISLFKAK